MGLHPKEERTLWILEPLLVPKKRRGPKSPANIRQLVSGFIYVSRILLGLQIDMHVLQVLEIELALCFSSRKR